MLVFARYFATFACYGDFSTGNNSKQITCHNMTARIGKRGGREGIDGK